MYTLTKGALQALHLQNYNSEKNCTDNGKKSEDN